MIARAILAVPTILVLAGVLFAAPSESPKPLVVTHDFDDAKKAAGAFVATSTPGARKGSEPGLRDGKLYLLQSWWKFATVGQLSGAQVLTGKPGSPQPSASRSVQRSQESPRRSASASSCSGFSTPPAK